MATDLLKGTHTDLSRILGKVYGHKMPLFVHGTFGIGKTRGAEKFARQQAEKLGLEFSKDSKDLNNESKFCFISIILHQYDAGEIKGIPFPSQDKTHTVYLPVGLLPEKGQGIIFFDEMNLAPPMMQNNAYQLIEDRQLGSYKVPDGYLCIGAGNLVDDRGNTFEMPMPLNNRFLHFQLDVPTVDDIEKDGVAHKGWVNDFALNNGVDHRIINYLMYQNGDLFKYNPDTDDQVVAVPTPRSWEKCSTMIKGVTDYGELELYASMAVGTSIAQSFVAWLKLSKNYDIKGIFEGKIETPKPADIGELYSLISALVGHYVEHTRHAVDEPINSEKAKKVNDLSIKILTVARAFNKEHTVMMLQQGLANDSNLLKRIKKTDVKLFTEFSDSIFKLLI